MRKISRGTVVAVAVAVTCLVTTSSTLEAMLFQAYHDQTGNQHQQQYNALKAQGYHMISLSVYGEDAPDYAAVWVQEPSPNFIGFHGLGEAECRAFIQENLADGYRPEIITATGTEEGSAIFAGVVVQDDTPFSYDLSRSEDDFKTITENWRNGGHYLACMDIYGSPDNPLYAGVWLANKAPVAWNYDTRLTCAELDATFHLYEEQWARPRMFAVGFDTGKSCFEATRRQYAAIWTDDSVGPTLVQHHMTSAEYDDAAKNLPEGFYPISVNAGGKGGNARFAAIFATRHRPKPRQWSVSGQSHPQLDGMDQEVEDYMKRNGIRAGQLAVAHDGRLVHSRAFTWALPGYPKTTQTNVFRIASSSKPLTAIAIMQLIEKNLLTENDAIQSILNIQPQGGSLHPDFDDVKVIHLLQHQGGWDNSNDGLASDPMFNELEFTGDSFDLGWTLPISKYQIASYMSTNMQFPPGGGQVYSNFGFSLLGQIIEMKMAANYEFSVQSKIFGPLGVTRPRIGKSLLADALPGEVRYHAAKPLFVTTKMDESGDLVPQPYGGMNITNLDAHGGWVMAAVDYAKVLAAFDLNSDQPGQDRNPLLSNESVNTMWGSNIGGYSYGWGIAGNSFSHQGAINGTRAIMFHRNDTKVSVVAFFNGFTSGHDPYSSADLEVALRTHRHR